MTKLLSVLDIPRIRAEFTPKRPVLENIAYNITKNEQMSITIYTKDFDSGENVSGNGMSGKTFLDADGFGDEFGSFADAVLRADDLGKIPLDLTVCFRKDGVQKFRKFKIAPWDNG